MSTRTYGFMYDDLTDMVAKMYTLDAELEDFVNRDATTEIETRVFVGKRGRLNLHVSITTQDE